MARRHTRQENEPLTEEEVYVRRARRYLRTRRFIVFGVLAVLVGVGTWIALGTDLLSPFADKIDVVRRYIDWARESPSRMLMAIGAILVPHMGMFMYISDELEGR